MARIPRSYMKMSFFHIMVQGISKEYIFQNDKDKEKYIKLIKSNQNEFNIKIIAFCVMNNHIHLLIEIQKIEDMTNFMHRINTLYAIYYNKKYNRVGYVFRDRYKSQMICTEKHMYLCVNYIHENPIKANICINTSEYKYSSFVMEYECNQTKVMSKIANILNGVEHEVNIKPKDNFEDKFEFLECEKLDKYKICQEQLKIFLNQNEINEIEIQRNNKYLKEIVKILKNDYNISYRVMEDVMKISREKLRKLLKNSSECSM